MLGKITCSVLRKVYPMEMQFLEPLYRNCHMNCTIYVLPRLVCKIGTHVTQIRIKAVYGLHRHFFLTHTVYGIVCVDFKPWGTWIHAWKSVGGKEKWLLASCGYSNQVVVKRVISIPILLFKWETWEHGTAYTLINIDVVTTNLAGASFWGLR